MGGLAIAMGGDEHEVDPLARNGEWQNTNRSTPAAATSSQLSDSPRRMPSFTSMSWWPTDIHPSVASKS